MTGSSSSFVPDFHPAPAASIAQASRGSATRAANAAATAHRALIPDLARSVLDPRHGDRTKRPREAWTVPLHIVVWAAITVGFIVAALLMH
jgi:hypothetical protein